MHAVDADYRHGNEEDRAHNDPGMHDRPGQAEESRANVPFQKMHQCSQITGINKHNEVSTFVVLI